MGEDSSQTQRDLHPALQSLLSKYPKLIPSLALLFSLGDGRKGSVDLVYLRMALKWGVYLFSHAQRIYGIQTKIEEAVSILAEKVRSGAVLSGMTLREIKRKGWSGLKEESSHRISPR
jgi:putative DNA primase/helicase